MKVTRNGRSVTVEVRSDGEGLVSHAGAALLAEAADGDLRSQPSFIDDAAVTVVLCAGNYPLEPYDVGYPIEGMDDAAAVDGVVLFEYAVGRNDAGAPVVAGGRVISVTALGPSIDVARERAYEAVGHISWPNMHYRTDIAAP